MEDGQVLWIAVVATASAIAWLVEESQLCDRFGGRQEGSKLSKFKLSFEQSDKDRLVEQVAKARLKQRRDYYRLLPIMSAVLLVYLRSK